METGEKLSKLTSELNDEDAENAKNQIEGENRGESMGRAHKILPRTDPRNKIPFMFIYKSAPHPSARTRVLVPEFWCGGRRSCSSGCSTAASRAREGWVLASTLSTRCGTRYTGTRWGCTTPG